MLVPPDQGGGTGGAEGHHCGDVLEGRRGSRRPRPLRGGRLLSVRRAGGVGGVRRRDEGGIADHGDRGRG